MEELSRSNTHPESSFDYELILSRLCPFFSVVSGNPSYSVPAFYDQRTNKFYLKIDPTDSDFYEKLMKIQKGSVVGSYGSEYLPYPESDPFKRLTYNTRKLLDIPGVIGGSYHLTKGKREYWRFLFLEENLDAVSDFLLEAAKEREGNKESELMIEYLGRPHYLHWFLEEYRYSKEVVKLKEREILNAEYLKNAPLYKHPFHFDLKMPDAGNGFVRTIRFSLGECESEHSLKDQYRIRRGDLFVTEDVRLGKISNDIFDIEEKRMSPALWHSCDFDGKESYNTYYLDNSELSNFLKGTDEINEAYRGMAKLIIDSIETYYVPK